VQGRPEAQECTDASLKKRVVGGSGYVHADAPYALLRARRERQRSRPNPCDEFPTLHTSPGLGSASVSGQLGMAKGLSSFGNIAMEGFGISARPFHSACPEFAHVIPVILVRTGHEKPFGPVLADRPSEKTSGRWQQVLLEAVLHCHLIPQMGR